MSTFTRYAFATIAGVLASMCFWHGYVVVGVVWTLLSLPMFSRRIAAELFLTAVYLEMSCAPEGMNYYWYAKAHRCGDCEDVHATPVFGSVKGRMWMNFWRTLNHKTYPEFAAAVRANLAWHSENT